MCVHAHVWDCVCVKTRMVSRPVGEAVGETGCVTVHGDLGQVREQLWVPVMEGM